VLTLAIIPIDGLFSNQKSKFGKILEGLAMEDVGTLNGHWVHFTVFCYILWTFGIVRGNLVHFFRFGIFSQEKSGNPALVIGCRKLKSLG
jgi:hypothetical protein